MDREELIRKYAGGEKDFTGGNFRSADWRDKIFRGGIYREADFSNAYFDSSHFMEADLSFAKFVGIRIYEGSFMNCYTEGADFSYATFGQVAFEKVNLSRAIFRNSTLSETGFYNTNLSYVDLRGVKRFNEVSFKNVIFCDTIMPDGSMRTGSV